MADNNINLLGKTRNLLMDVFNTKKQTEAFVPNSTQKPFPKNIPSKDYFERVSPEEQGIDSSYIAEYIKELSASKQLHMQDILIMRNGKVIFETAFGNNKPKEWKMTFSAAKSVIMLAVGLCIDRKLFSVNDKVISFFPEKLQGFSALTLKDLTVQHLLCMKSGVVFNEIMCVSESDWCRGFLNSMVHGIVGKDFAYNSLNTYMLAAIINKVTGKTVSEFLDENLFSYMDIKDYYWEKCPMGIEKGGWGLYMTSEDLAKLGLLVLNNGLWQGKRLLSEEWLSQATSLHSIAPRNCGEYNYGYQIWIGRKSNTFLFSGMFGQNVHGFYDSNVLVVSHSGTDDTFQSSDYYYITEKYFCKEFPEQLPENKAAYTELNEYKNSLISRLPEKSGRRLLAKLARRRTPIPSQAAGLSGKTFDATEVNYSFGILPFGIQATQRNYSQGFEGVSFVTEENRFFMMFKEKETYKVEIGFENTTRSFLSVNGENFVVDCLGKFASDEDENLVLVLNMLYSETPFVRILKIRFYKETDYKTAKIEIKETPSKHIVYKILDDYVKNVGEAIPLLTSLIAKTDLSFFDYKLDSIFEPVIILEEK